MKYSAFALKKDFDHLVDMDYDASHIPFPESEYFKSRITGIREFKLPQKIYCYANFNVIPKYDFPIVDIADSVFSDKMFSVFLELGGIKYRSVPVIMIDDTYLMDPFEINGDLKQDMQKKGKYAVVQLMEYADVFDFENSIYKKSSAIPGMVRGVTKTVFRGITGGYPPIFRIKENPGQLYINGECKEVLESHNIIGCSFESIEVN